MLLRLMMGLLSFAVHVGIAAFVLHASSSEANMNAALEEGSGDDQFVIESAISIEGVSKGADDVTMEAVEAPPPVLETVKPEEVKPLEDVQNVVGSEAGPEQEKIALEPPPEEEKKPEEQKPQEVAAIQAPPVIAVDEKQAAGKNQEGGDVTALNAYRGKLFIHIGKKKVNPRTTVSGTAKIRFSFDPATGQLLNREVVQSSGSPVLDKAALDSIERSAPFPPVPVAVAQGPFEVTVPFKFSVR